MSALTPQQATQIASGDPQALAQALNSLAAALTSTIRQPQTSAAQSPAYPGSGSPYTNNTTFLQQVVVSGGTVTAITLSQGGVTGETAGAWILRPGDSITVTSSVNPTVFTATNLI